MFLFCSCTTQNVVPHNSCVTAVKAENGWCSGVFIKNELLTARHCTRESYLYYNTIINQSLMTNITRTSEDDISYSKIDFVPTQCVKYRNPILNESVIVKTWDGENIHTKITSIDLIWNIAKLNFKPQRGMSGSPVYSTDDELLCIVTGYIVNENAGQCELLDVK